MAGFSADPDPATAAELISVLEAAPTFQVRDGIVAFAISLRLGGAGMWKPDRAPAPPGWRQAIWKSQEPIAVDSLADRLWPKCVVRCR